MLHPRFVRVLGKRLPWSYQQFQSFPPLQSRVGTVSALIGLSLVGSAAYGGYTWQNSESVEGAKKAVRIQRIVPTLDVMSATAKLKQQEETSSFRNGQIWAVRVPSNSPVEDDLIRVRAAGAGNAQWEFWGVFDGHAGWATSSTLRELLVPYVSQHLQKIKDSRSGEPQAIVEAITKAFITLDNDILNTAKDALTSKIPSGNASVASAIAPAMAGSCALLSLFDPNNRNLWVACVGDSRAVLGRWNPDTETYSAEPLSADQTGFNESEFKRVTSEHPGEETVIDPKSGRVLGIAVSRAFGDSKWKFPEAIQRLAEKRFWGFGPISKAVSPPYLTAEPVVTKTVVQKGDFVVMASDGIWDHISSEDAVECIAMWLKAGGTAENGKAQTSKQRSSEPEFEVADGYAIWKVTPDDFVVEDDNAATHLVKNAFGGRRRNLFCGAMTMYPPRSRYVRDDATVQVILFNDL